MLKYSNISGCLFFALCSLIIGSMVLVACEGDNGTQSEQAETAQETMQEERQEDASARVIEIEGLDSLKFSVTKIEAKPGEEITVELINNTSMPASAMSHNFVLLKKGTNAGEFNNKVLEESKIGSIPEELNEFVIADTGMVAGGESKSVTFTVPEEPGEYEYICTFPGHYAAGMKGKLIVK